QRISETWRAHEADQLQLLLEQLLEHVKAGDIEKFYDAIFQYLAEQQDMVGNPYLMKFYKELLCTRQISQNPYPIRVLPS
ncbi:hypothetical protein J478_4213, partial [Acinetobacter baumannii 58452]